MSGRIHRAAKAQDGQAMVELALLLPLLIVLVLAIIQFGIVFNNYETLTDATRTGARQAILLRLNGKSVDSAKQVVRDAATGLDQAQLDVNVTAPDWTTPGTQVTVTAQYPYSIDLLGWTVSTGHLVSTMKERLE